MATRKKQVTFEDNFKQLEQIVTMLEKGETPLEQSIELFEQGMKISMELQQMIENAEQKISILTENSDGSITEQEFKQEDV